MLNTLKNYRISLIYLEREKVIFEEEFLKLFTSTLAIHDAKDDSIKTFLYSQDTDIAVLIGFEYRIPDEYINIPNKGFFNVHPSLLPKYRGASSVNHAIINGEQETGVTIHLIDSSLDHGPIINQKKVTISSYDTASTLFYNKMIPVVIELIHDLIRKTSENKLNFQKQEHSVSTFYKRISKTAGLVNWHQPSQNVHNFIRGMNSKPGAYFYYKGTILEIGETQISKKLSKKAYPGTYIVSNNTFYVTTVNNPIIIKKVRVKGNKNWFNPINLLLSKRREYENA